MKRYVTIVLLMLVLLTGCGEKSCKQHIDDNKDDICDRCDGSVIITIDFYCINDLHGRIMDSAAQPGVDEMTAYLNHVKQTDDHAVLLSAGDMWQGSAESNLTRGALVTDWMNALDFAAMTLGNHEFDWGESHISKNAELAEFPFLAINIYDAETKSLAQYCVPSRLVECGGVQIGLIGAIGDCHSSIAPDMARDVYFVTGHALTELVKKEALSLRNQGADFIVYLLHDGGASDSELSSYYDLSLSDGYVDLVFEGHSHHRYLLEDEFGVLHLQNGGDNTGGLSHVEISVHAIDGTTSIRLAELVCSDVYEALEDAPLVAELLEQYREDISPAFETYANLTTSVPGDDLRQLVADLYYMEGLVRWGSEYDIAVGGGYVSIRSPGYLARGEVTYRELLELFPFDNELVLCSIKGRDLIQRFLESDNSYYFICCSEELAEDIDENGIYYVVVDSYSSTYGPNRLTEIERYGDSYFARDMLANFIQNGGLK